MPTFARERRVSSGAAIEWPLKVCSLAAFSPASAGHFLLARCSPEQVSASRVRLLRTKRARIVTRTRAEEYRRLAQQCLAMARSASTEEGRATLLEAAQSWFRLVEEQDH